MTGRLERLDRCRRTARDARAHGFWNRFTTDFWLRQTERLAGPIGRRYVEVFKAEVDGPIERLWIAPLAGPEGARRRRRGAAANRGHRRVPVGGTLSGGECRSVAQLSHPLGVVEPRSQDNEETVRPSADSPAYLELQPAPAALDEMHGRDVARVSRWLSAGGLRTEWILASASSQFAPVRSRDFWGWDGPLQVDAPFTGRAWNDAIQPLTQGLRALAPNAGEVRDAVARFENDYRAEALRQWGQFLASFPQEERVLGGRRGSRDLAVRTLEADSPYRRVSRPGCRDGGAIAVRRGGTPTCRMGRTLLRYAALRKMV